MLEARKWWPEAFEVSRVAARRDGAHGAAVERTGEGYDLVAIDLPLGPEIMPRCFNSTLQRLGARIGEEHRIGEGGVDQALAKPLLLGNGEDVGSMPDFVGCRLERGDDVLIAMAKRIDGNARM